MLIARGHEGRRAAIKNAHRCHIPSSRPLVLPSTVCDHIDNMLTHPRNTRTKSCIRLIYFVQVQNIYTFKMRIFGLNYFLFTKNIVVCVKKVVKFYLFVVVCYSDQIIDDPS